MKKKLKVQNRFSWLKWVANKSQEQVAKNPCDKIWKKFLSVFRDWKVHPWGSCEGNLETFWVHLMIRASTCEQVARPSLEKSKNPNFWKIFLVFFTIGTLTHQRVVKTFYVSSRLGHATSLTRKACHQNKVAQFLTFFKTKYFPTKIKTLKNLFVFDQHIIKHVKHI